MTKKPLSVILIRHLEFEPMGDAKRAVEEMNFQIWFIGGKRDQKNKKIKIFRIF